MLACEKEHAIKVGNLAGKAAEATHAAEAVRRAAALGEVGAAEVEAAEIVRQQAVNRMEAGRDKLVEARADVGVWQDAWISNSPRKVEEPEDAAVARYEKEKREQMARDKLMVAQAMRLRAGNVFGLSLPAQANGLLIANMSARTGSDRKGEFVVLRGEILNSSGKSVPVPPLAGILLDERGWVVKREVVRPDRRKRLRPGQAYPFGFEIRSAPLATEQAIVVFAVDAPAERIGVGIVCPRG